MNGFTFTISQKIFLDQLLGISTWLGEPLQNILQQSSEIERTLEAGIEELERKGWIARQLDVSLGISSGLLATLQSIRDAQSIAFITGRENDNIESSVVLFKDEEHFVLQTWDKNRDIDLFPFIDIRTGLSLVSTGIQNTLFTKRINQIQESRFYLEDGEWKTIKNESISYINLSPSDEEVYINRFSEFLLPGSKVEKE